MRDFNTASGAASNYGKCDGLRMGSLRGVPPPAAVLRAQALGGLRDIRWRDLDSDAVHTGFDCKITRSSAGSAPVGSRGVALSPRGGGWLVEVSGRRWVIPTDHLAILPTRYLGIQLGGRTQCGVRGMPRCSRVPAVAGRLQSLRATGLPATIYGRTTVIKTLVFSKAIFYLTNQAPIGLDDIVRDWSRTLTDVQWTTAAGDEREAAGERRGHPPALVAHDTAVQDHGDFGARALDVSSFVDALHATWLRRLTDPAPQPWRNVLWGAW